MRTPDATRASYRPRILFVSMYFDPEPGTVLGLTLARRLQREYGYDVEVLTAIPQYPIGRYYPGYRFKFITRETMDDITVLRVPIYPSHDTSALRRILTYSSFTVSATLLGALRVKKPDVIYYFDSLPTTGAVARVIARLTGARTVQHVADMWPETVTESGMIRNPRMRKAVHAIVGAWCSSMYRRHARIAVLSEGFKRMLVERGVPENKISVVYNWADERLFFPAAPDTQLAQELGLAGRFNIIYAGNFGPLQSLETILDAARRLTDLPDLQFVLIGTGPLEAELRARAAEYRLPNVRFIARMSLESMNRVNALADAHLVHLRDTTTMRATIPQKTQVALASQRPVLLGVRGDAAALVESAGAGLIFEPQNAADLERAVRALHSMSDAERAGLAAAGRAYYEKELSLAAGSRRMHEVFQSVLERRHAAA